MPPHKHVPTTPPPPGLQDDPEAFVNSFPSFHLLEEFFESKFHYVKKSNFLDEESQPQRGSVIIIAYKHQGAKNFKEMGLHWRYPAFIYDGSKWHIFKIPFKGGAEVNCSFEPLEKMHPLHKQVALLLDSDGPLPCGSRMSWKWDGQFFKFSVCKGSVADLLEAYIEDTNSPFAQVLLETSKEHLPPNHVLILSTNGTAIAEDEQMIRNLITSICDGPRADGISKMETIDAFREVVIPFVTKKFLPLFEDIMHERGPPESDILFGCNFEVTCEGRIQGLACHEPSTITAIGCDISAAFFPQFHDSISPFLAKHGISQAESFGDLTGEKIRGLVDRCEQYIKTPREDRAGLNFFEEGAFHPEGFVLFVPIEDDWVYCKIKTQAYYIAHKGHYPSLMAQYPRSSGDFFPAIAEAFAASDALEKFLPGTRERTLKYMDSLHKHFVEHVKDAYDPASDNSIDVFIDFLKGVLADSGDITMESRAAKPAESLVKTAWKVGSVSNFANRILHVPGLAEIPVIGAPDCSALKQILINGVAIAALDQEECDSISSGISALILNKGDINRNIFYRILKSILVHPKVTMEDIKGGKSKISTDIRDLTIQLLLSLECTTQVL